MKYQTEITEKWITINNHSYDRILIEKIIRRASDPEIENIVLDGFSGIGGVTEGFSRLSNYVVIACINHWNVAIETHQKNHPDCLHLQEDFRIADIAIIVYMVDRIRKNNPGIRFHTWFSLECTNFSNAKGGMSRNADSRTLADHMDRYVIELNPDVIWIENVKEFMLWGPMVAKVQAQEKGKKKTLHYPKEAIGNIEVQTNYYRGLIATGLKPFCPLITDKKKKKKDPDQIRRVHKWNIPCPYRKGQDFEKWKEYTCLLGYKVDKKVMNCADYGVPQHRVRLIMQFNKNDHVVSWPEQTHDKKGKNGLPFWKPVRPCLDLTDEGTDVMSFKLVKGQTTPRITSEATIDRLINGCEKQVIKKQENSWIVKPYSANNNTKQSSGASCNAPSSTVTCFGGLNVAKAYMIDHYFGKGYVKSITEPAGVSGTKDGISLQSVQFLSTYYSTGNGNKLEAPSPAIMTNDKHPLVSVDRFIMDTQYNKQPHGLDQPSRTQTASRKHFYLVNFQWFNEGFRTVDNPSNTIMARLDKVPNYLITLETGELAIEVFEHDPPHYVKLKKYMAEKGIIRINMRMLKETELLKIMTMPADTKLSRSSTDNKKMIGNAVPSDLVEQLAAAWDKEIKYKQKIA